MLVHELSAILRRLHCDIDLFTMLLTTLHQLCVYMRAFEYRTRVYGESQIRVFTSNLISCHALRNLSQYRNIRNGISKTKHYRNIAPPATADKKSRLRPSYVFISKTVQG